MENCEINYEFIYGEYYDLLDLCDVRIITEKGCTCDGHKVILANGSDYFKRMFLGFDKGKTEYRISNINSKVLRDIFMFLHTKNTSLTETNVKDILTTSDFLMKDVYLKAKQVVKNTITYNNCLKHLEVAYQVNDSELLDYWLKFIVRHFKNVMLGDLEELLLELLKCVLGNRNLNVKNEILYNKL